MDLLHRKAQSYKFSNKNDLFCAWRDFNKTFCGISPYHKWMFKLQISSIFHFDRAHQSWISGLLGVNIFGHAGDKFRIKIRAQTPSYHREKKIEVQTQYFSGPESQGRYFWLDFLGSQKWTQMVAHMRENLKSSLNINNLLSNKF